MAYTINKFNGEQLIVLDDGTIDTSTSLGLVGRNYVGYGETQNENFVFLLENFANDAPPSRPLRGQIWFNTLNNLTFVYDGNAWAPIGSAVLSVTAPQNPNVGSLWLQTPANILNVWNGATWSFIGPETAPGFGITRCRSTTIKDSNNVDRPVIFLEINSVITAVCTNSAFTINPSNAIPNLDSNLIAGINLINNFKINGSISGTSESANRLTTARSINGVAFDGQQNITIKSSTTNKLSKGTYILGSDFDGSAQTTWSVDATPSNIIGKLVARNSEGGFAAGTITATFVGNLTGNVNSSGTSDFNIVRANQFIGATLSGNAFSASQLETGRRINGVIFDGTRDITITSAAGTLTGNTLNSTVTLSSLTTVGTLNELSISDIGASIGAGGQLRLLVDSGTPTIRSNTGQLNFDIGSAGPDVSFVNATTSVLLGGPNAPAIIGDNTTNLGINGYKFNNIYANNFLGNATTATTAVTSTNIAGGGLGSLLVQSAANTTSFVNLGADGYVLRARPSGPNWEALNFEQLNKGAYLNFVNTNTSGAVSSFNSTVPVTISVDATTTNTASKIVARDASGNFAAGTITANLAGSASLNVLKSGDTMSGFLTLNASPVNPLHAATKNYVDSAVNGLQYYDEFANGIASPGPQTFPQRSIRGFSAYNSSDFPGLYYGGITVSGPSGVYSGQLAFNWNSEEAAPTGLYFRVNDDTSNTAAWSAWKQVATSDQVAVYTSGNTIYAVGFTNIVGSWSNASNYFDVFPPAGKTMLDLVAFIPSIAVIHYAGVVNGDDSTRCTWSNLGDRVRIYVQNTEQRSTPAANYLAIWR